MIQGTVRFVNALAAWVPVLVLLAIWIAMQLYLKRKLRTLPASPLVVAGPGDCISIGRDGANTAADRPFRVFLDGAPAGEIHIGEVRHLSTPPGPHTIKVRAGWFRARSLRVDKRPGENLPLRCGADYEGLRAFYNAFIATNNYVYLRRASK